MFGVFLISIFVFQSVAKPMYSEKRGDEQDNQEAALHNYRLDCGTRDMYFYCTQQKLKFHCKSNGALDSVGNSATCDEYCECLYDQSCVVSPSLWYVVCGTGAGEVYKKHSGEVIGQLAGNQTLTDFVSSMASETRDVAAELPIPSGQQATRNITRPVDLVEPSELDRRNATEAVKNYVMYCHDGSQDEICSASSLGYRCEANGQLSYSQYSPSCSNSCGCVPICDVTRWGVVCNRDINDVVDDTASSQYADDKKQVNHIVNNTAISKKSEDTDPATIPDDTRQSSMASNAAMNATADHQSVMNCGDHSSYRSCADYPASYRCGSDGKLVWNSFYPSCNTHCTCERSCVVNRWDIIVCGKLATREVYELKSGKTVGYVADNGTYIYT